MDEESVKNGIPMGITSSYMLIQIVEINMCEKSPEQGKFHDQRFKMPFISIVNFFLIIKLL
jgi:hypothetical protein